MNDWVIAAFYVGVTVAGAAVGTAELVSRYRDAPVRALVTVPAGVYVALNALSSFGALALIRQMNWLADVSTDPVNRLLIQTTVAGLGAMAFFRSAIFTVRVGSEDVSVGPAGLLQVLLTAADRACDRSRAGPRAEAISHIMKDIAFDKAKQALPALCFGLMQNVSVEEQKSFGIVVKELEAAQMDAVVKANNLGLALMNLVGQRVLGLAVDMLRRAISDPPRPLVQSIETLRLLKNFDFLSMGEHLVTSTLFVSGQVEDRTRETGLRGRFESIRDLPVSADQKTLLLSACLISNLGEESVQRALRGLLAGSDAAAAAAPAPMAPLPAAAPPPQPRPPANEAAAR